METNNVNEAISKEIKTGSDLGSDHYVLRDVVKLKYYGPSLTGAEATKWRTLGPDERGVHDSMCPCRHYSLHQVQSWADIRDDLMSSRERRYWLKNGVVPRAAVNGIATAGSAYVGKTGEFKKYSIDEKTLSFDSSAFVDDIAAFLTGCVVRNPFIDTEYERAAVHFVDVMDARAMSKHGYSFNPMERNVIWEDGCDRMRPWRRHIFHDVCGYDVTVANEWNWHNMCVNRETHQHEEVDGEDILFDPQL